MKDTRTRGGSRSLQDLYSISLIEAQGSLVHLSLTYATLASQLHSVASEVVLPTLHIPKLMARVSKTPSALLRPKAVVLLQGNSGACPEAESSEKKVSWVRQHMIDPFKEVVREVVI